MRTVRIAVLVLGADIRVLVRLVRSPAAIINRDRSGIVRPHGKVVVITLTNMGKVGPPVRVTHGMIIVGDKVIVEIGGDGNVLDSSTFVTIGAVLPNYELGGKVDHMPRLGQTSSLCAVLLMGALAMHSVLYYLRIFSPG